MTQQKEQSALFWNLKNLINVTNVMRGSERKNIFENTKQMFIHTRSIHDSMQDSLQY
jgi:hypothetical protein